ncbi:hypothetical protein [Saccharomonospora xinjiangensis]|uniref:hypothetical protein n=1 Tax=Saccharomonospora xinjiangensis TaxID=75294 RepID=UPI00106F6E66|nr:hypothetical protein [Saccharomonospora xinjiangensis]
MTEHDLGLKVMSRRLLWRMGFSTRVDVPLRAFVPTGDRRRTRYESFTDLDVLGVMATGGFDLHRVIADCKTSVRGSTERMFWIRGVADFFAADSAWMVRSSGVTAAARQLSARLGISVIEQNDLSILEGHHPTDLQLVEGPLSLLFDVEAVGRYVKSFSALDKKLINLVEYRQFDYWVYDEHRNLLQVVAHLREVSEVLDPTHPAHRALFYESAWLYTLSLAQAAAYVRAAHVTAADTALQEYLFGGQIALQEKQRLATLLQKLAPKGGVGSGAGVLPEWYPQLLELLTRHLRRPYVLNSELRYAEWLAEAQQAKLDVTVSSVFGGEFDPVAAKLLADVCGFLVTMAKLDPEFRARARMALAQPGGADELASREVSREKEGRRDSIGGRDDEQVIEKPDGDSSQNRLL